jgi:DNA topoisomerase-2
MVVENELKIMKRKKKDVEIDLENNKFDKINDTFEYLLSIPVSTLTYEKYIDLLNKLNDAKNELNEYKNKSIYDIWNEELDRLLK